MTNIKKGITIRDFINILVITIYLLLFIFPPLRSNFELNLILSSIIFLIWIIFSFVYCPNYFIKSKYFWGLMYFMLYTILIPYFLSNPTIGNRYFSFSFILTFSLIAEYNYYIGKNYINKFAFFLILPFIILTTVITSYNLIMNPYISRSIKSEGIYSSSLLAQGIGGYDFIYFSVFLFLVIYLFSSHNKKNMSLKNPLILITWLTIFITILLSNYLTALILICFGLLLYYFVGLIEKKKWIQILFLFFIGLLVFLFKDSIIQMIFEFLLRIFEAGRVNEALLELNNSLVSNNSLSLETTRWVRMQTSLSTFSHNPFFGIVGKNEGSGISDLLVGQHSFILDTLALMGFFYTLFFHSLLFNPLLKISKLTITKILKGKIFVIAAVLLLFIILNNLSPSVGVITGFILPMYIYSSKEGAYN